MIWARWAGVMGVMKWEIARIFVVGTGGSGLCAKAEPSGEIGFFMAVAPYSSLSYQNCGASVFNFYLPKLSEESVQRSWLEIHSDGRHPCSPLPSVLFFDSGRHRLIASPIFAVELDSG